MAPRNNDSKTYAVQVVNNALPDDETQKLLTFFKENLARYKLNSNGKKLKALIIDDIQYRYNPTKPMSNKFKNKLESKRKTNEYRACQIKEQSATDTVQKITIRQRAKITEDQNAFKSSSNAYTISIFILRD